MPRLLLFIQTNALTVVLCCLLAGLLLLGIREGVGQQQAQAQGICLKAQARTGLFTGTVYQIYLRYEYQGKSYHATLPSATRLTSDSVLIKVLPAHPEYVAWYETAH
jgi:hypothetical protein